MKAISIQQVLAQIQEDDQGGATFLIKFVRSTGRQKGSIKIVAKARYGAPNPRARGQLADDRPPMRKVKLHVDAGTLPLTDTETNTYFTPLISHIIGFNQYQVIH